MTRKTLDHFNAGVSIAAGVEMRDPRISFRRRSERGARALFTAGVLLTLATATLAGGRTGVTFDNGQPGAERLGRCLRKRTRDRIKLRPPLDLSRFRSVNQRKGLLRFAACADSQGVGHGGKVSGYGE